MPGHKSLTDSGAAQAPGGAQPFPLAADLPAAAGAAGSAPAVGVPALRPNDPIDVVPDVNDVAGRNENPKAWVRAVVSRIEPSGVIYALLPGGRLVPVVQEGVTWRRPQLKPGEFSVPGALRVPSPSTRPGASFVVCSDGEDAIDHPANEVCIVEKGALAGAPPARFCACTTALGMDRVHCAMCSGDRCAVCCGSIDHRGGRLISQVTILDARRLDSGGFEVVVRSEGMRYRSEVRRFEGKKDGGALAKKADGSPAQWEGVDSDAVMREAHALVDRLRQDAERKAFAPVAAAVALDAMATADRGDETCSEADHFDPEFWAGLTPELVAHSIAIPLPTRGRAENDRGRRLSNAIAAHLLNADHAWRELEDMIETGSDGFGKLSTFERVRRLRDAELCALIQTIGGVR